MSGFGRFLAESGATSTHRHIDLAVEHRSMHFTRGTAALASGKVQAQTGIVLAESRPKHREAITTYGRGTVPDKAIAEYPNGLRRGKVCCSIHEAAGAIDRMQCFTLRTGHRSTTPPGMSVTVAAIGHLVRRANPHHTATPPTAAESG